MFIKSHSGVWRGAVLRDSLVWKRFPECISRGPGWERSRQS